MDMNATPREHRNTVTPTEIALCAYAIWDKEGRPQGHATEHWLQAEAQLKLDHQQDSHRSVKRAIAEALAAHKAKHPPVPRKGARMAGERSHLRTQAA